MLAGHLDGGLIGSWRQWRELYRLRSAPLPNAREASVRKDLLKDMENVLWARSADEPDKNGSLGRKPGRPRRYSAGTIWRKQLPIERMRQIMRGIVWIAGAERANAAGMTPSRRAATESEGEPNWMQALDLDPPVRPVIEIMRLDRLRILSTFTGVGGVEGFEGLVQLQEMDPGNAFCRGHPTR
ncbi:hypothetical protein D9758_017160 [Tetrapyrgos nigripes]|uniref:Uncharacterized protein n=1 Tax=Tetrapyrgos nigripes TaxID=182062 RepID=A0A8H5F9Y0_9AGAR|nr:hypothetical protein D9758_017160 [Tetrapyrgos nigripes]